MGNIPTQEEPVKRQFWRKIPGFRSGKKWKMVTASVFYGILLLFFIGAMSSDPDNTPQQTKDKTKVDQTQKAVKPEQAQTQPVSQSKPSGGVTEAQQCDFVSFHVFNKSRFPFPHGAFTNSHKITNLF